MLKSNYAKLLNNLTTISVGIKTVIASKQGPSKEPFVTIGAEGLLRLADEIMSNVDFLALYFDEEEDEH